MDSTYNSKNTDRHDITEILLKVVLNALTLTLYLWGKWKTQRKPMTCHRKTLYHIKWYQIHLIMTLLLIGIDHLDRCKSNHNMI